MKSHWTMKASAGALAALGICVGSAAADEGRRGKDFGALVETLLESKSEKLFGIRKPLASSAEGNVARAPGQTPYDNILLAEGLEAEYLTRNAGNLADMFAFWPNDVRPTHLIACIEGGRQEIAPGKYNPSVQRIDLRTGAVETLLRGMSRCDGIRSTGWGTILVTEETGDGGAYEILDPLAITNETVIDRATGANTAPEFVAKRQALPTMAWEGLTVLDSGVVIAGDELRPGSGIADTDGGAIFKFVPDVPRTDDGPIRDLADSPLAAGRTYALQVSCVSSRQQYGQGCEVGNGAWIMVNAATARSDADAYGATGYYRPEDLHRDPTYTGEGVRFCWANTGNEGAKNYGEVVCGIDSAPLVADMNQRTVEVNRFVEGDTQLNALDNLAFQPITGNLYVIEDHRNGDVWACLPDGTDRDIKSDGCVRVLSVKDQSAEPTGFMFSADGRTAYLSVQHSDDSNMAPVDDYGTDDIIRITGSKVKHERRDHHDRRDHR